MTILLSCFSCAGKIRCVGKDTNWGPRAMSKLSPFVYVSSAVSILSNEDFEHLLSKARERNLEHNISVLQLFIGGNFMQCIEREADHVDYIFEVIMEDAMHTGLIKLLPESIENREFSN